MFFVPISQALWNCLGLMAPLLASRLKMPWPEVAESQYGQEDKRNDGWQNSEIRERGGFGGEIKVRVDTSHLNELGLAKTH